MEEGLGDKRAEFDSAFDELVNLATAAGLALEIRIVDAA